MQIGVIDSNSPLTLYFFNAEQDRQTLNGSHSHIYGNISTLLNMFVSVPVHPWSSNVRLSLKNCV